MKTIEYPYKPGLKITLLGIFLFGGGAAMMAQAALGNDSGLVINGIVRLEPRGATIFYWCMAATCSAFLLLGMAVLLVRLTSKARLRLSPTEFSAPRHAFGGTIATIPLAEIQTIHVYAVQDQHFLDITHSHGTLTILRSCLPSTAAFEEVCRVLGAVVARRS